jgi:hypothetical protein
MGKGGRFFVPCLAADSVQSWLSFFVAFVSFSFPHVLVKFDLIGRIIATVRPNSRRLHDASKIARTANLQSSLPSCHLRSKGRERRATFVAGNASSAC